jgi:hypothetical protein
MKRTTRISVPLAWHLDMNSNASLREIWKYAAE